MRKEKMKKQRILKNKGITLIALVVTIVVLLILAGVSISMLAGENGIIRKAQESKDKTEKAEVEEQVRLAIMTSRIEGNGQINIDTLKKELEKIGWNGEVTGLPTEGTINGVKVKIEEDGTVKVEEGTTTGSQGKTIAELYDGINKPEDEGYDENAMHIGDWVNYTAGSWGEDEGVAIPTSSTPFTFGGYNDGQSRDENANGTYTGARAGATYEGWRIWDISDDKQTITLISAGCPEEYYHPYGTNNAYISEYILSGNVNANADATSLGLGTTYTKRDWSIYKNETQYANNARALTKGDLDTWYGKYIDSSITDTWDVSSFPANDANKLISTVENQCYYWLSSASSAIGVYVVDPGRRGVNIYVNHALGVRVLVALASEVKFEETPEEVEKDGFTYNKWIIESK